jgi:hypothetical protein
MDGEYFRGPVCPRDGHSNGTSMEIAALVATMREEGVVPSIEALVGKDFRGTLEDVIVIEFASRRFAPDWLTPSDNLYDS